MKCSDHKTLYKLMDYKLRNWNFNHGFQGRPRLASALILDNNGNVFLLLIAIFTFLMHDFVSNPGCVPYIPHPIQIRRRLLLVVYLGVQVYRL